MMDKQEFIQHTAAQIAAALCGNISETIKGLNDRSEEIAKLAVKMATEIHNLTRNLPRN